MTPTAPILKPLGDLLAREEHPAAPVESVCAWCQRLYGWPARPNQTHGICAEHKAAMLADLERLQHIK